MVEFLRHKYAQHPSVHVLNQDICSSAFSLDVLGAPVDYISAIGVMFHITDDDRWRQALRNLRDVLKPGGLMFIGGDFGARTANVQFHRSDTFSNWKEFQSAEGNAGEVRVARRLRSLKLWSCTVADLGLQIATSCGSSGNLRSQPRRTISWSCRSDACHLPPPGRLGGAYVRPTQQHAGA